jgi:hypothetical protein
LIGQTNNAFHFPGANLPLSGSAKAVLQQYASLTATGVSDGESLGVISFAQFNDRFYFLPSGTLDFQEVDTIGNNVLNTGGFGSLVSIANSGLNQITFAKQQGGAVASLVALKSLPHSGATRAFLNRYELIARNSVFAGRNLVSHPLGGQFSGTYFNPTTPGMFTPGGSFLFAFGNDPFNNPALTQISVSNPTSFLLLANGKKLFISNGELLSTFYRDLGGGRFFSAGYNVYALANNPLNKGLAAPNISVNPSTFVNYLLK